MNKKILNKTGYKAVYIILTYVFLILFLAGIFLYNWNLISEKLLLVISLISAVLYIGLRALGFENDKEARLELKEFSERPVIQKQKSFFNNYMSYLNTLNIYLFPFISLAAVIIVSSAGAGFTSGVRAQDIITLYIISLGILLINFFTANIYIGFLRFSGKAGAFLKTLLYIFIPAYLIGLSLIAKQNVMISDFLISFFILAGSLLLIYRDQLYRKAGLPVLSRSGGAFFGSYFKNLLRYGIIILVILGAYYGSVYFRDHDFSDLFVFTPREMMVSPFRDLPMGHWAFPAMYYLYENGVIIPDEGGFVYPDKVLNVSEVISFIFPYFSVQTADFNDESDVDFRYIRKNDAVYPLFKAAYYIGITGPYIKPDETAVKDFALLALAILDKWAPEELKNYSTRAYERGVIKSADPRELNQPLSRAVLSQMIFNLEGISD